MTQGSLPLPPLLIPGPLVVSQGLPGDGMRNALTEPVPVWRDLIRADAENNHVSAAESQASHIVTTLPPLTTVTAPTAPDATTPATAPTTTSTELLQAMELWQEEAKSRQLYRYKEWKELWHQQTNSNKSFAENNSLAWMQMSSPTAWWRCRGQVAVWSTLPDTAANQPPKAIAALAPGTAVHATALYEWNGRGAPRKVLPMPTSASAGACGAGGGSITGGLSPRSTTAYPSAEQQQQQQQHAYPWNSMQEQCGTCLILKIESPKRGYCVFSLDGYPLLQPGVVEDWAQPSCWYWKVTCPAGAYVRDGLELATRHAGTLPYGAVVQVLKQRVNQAGLPRLQIAAHMYDPATAAYKRLQGWCSTALNPLSGQRGAILQPLPLPRPTVYRIVLPQGAVIRQDLELASPVVGHAPFGSWVTVIAQAFSDFPADRAVARLRLAGGGWISTRLNHSPPGDLALVECVGADEAYDTERPALFHYVAQRQAVLLQLEAQEEQERQQDEEECTHPDANNNNNNEQDEDDGENASMETSTIRRVGLTTRPMTTVGVATASSASLASALTTQTPTAASGSNGGGCYYHPVTPPMRRGSTTADAHSETAASVHPAAKPCLCCMENPRDATLVHGGTGHIVCCLPCARILQAQGQKCPVCRLEIDLVIKHYFG